MNRPQSAGFGPSGGAESPGDLIALSGRLFAASERAQVAAANARQTARVALRELTYEAGDAAGLAALEACKAAAEADSLTAYMTATLARMAEAT